jgi:S1-C subfamily serine protease
MRKTPLYSRSRPPTPAADSQPPERIESPAGAPAGTTPDSRPRSRIKGMLARNERRVWAAAVMLLIAGGVALHGASLPRSPALTMAQIDAAMRKSIEDKPLPSPVAAAYDAVIPSVVRVVGLMSDGDDGSDPDDTKDGAEGKPQPPGKTSRLGKSDRPRGNFERGVGTGVVIIDNGTILTNLHVIHGARRIKVTFMDGTESDAVVLSTQPENDLAVLRAKTIPDDLEAATLRSTADLAPGDQVMAIGFPFGIGPSASSGVVSGLKREFRSPEGKQNMTNLIQFDAAANPGNSGGPLVTMDGEVVGIVTAILNPSHQRTFIGIGFAVPIENAAAAVGMPPF